MKRHRSPTPPLPSKAPRTPTLFEILQPRRACSEVPASTASAAFVPCVTDLSTQPQPEQRSDSDVQDTLVVNLNREAPSLTAQASLDMVRRHFNVYQATVLCIIEIQKDFNLYDSTCAAALATALRVFSNKNIDMSRVEMFEAVCLASIFLACGRYEHLHKAKNLRIAIRGHCESHNLDTFKQANGITFLVLQDIGFEFIPTALDFLEAACRQCTPQEVTVVKAGRFFSDIVQHLMRLTMFVSFYAEFLPSELCFGCALAVRQMLDFRADVPLTPVDSFNMDKVRAVCGYVMKLYQKDARSYATSLYVIMQVSLLQQHIQTELSAIRALIRVKFAAATHLVSVTRRLLHTSRAAAAHALSGPPA